MPTFVEVFDPDDPVARFTVTMTMASNDVLLVLRHAELAVCNDAPEANYPIRLGTCADHIVPIRDGGAP